MGDLERQMTERGIINPFDLSLDLLVLVKGSTLGKSAELESLMEKFVIASGSIRGLYGFSVNTMFALQEAWLAQKLGIVEAEHPDLREAFEGICVRGQLPREEDYFQLHDEASPSPPDKIVEWLRKGYIAEANGGCVYTEKAIRRFKEIARSNIIETTVVVLGTKVQLITIGRPELLS